MFRLTRAVTVGAYSIIGASALVAASTLLPVHANAPMGASATEDPTPVTVTVPETPVPAPEPPVTVTPAPEPQDVQAQVMDGAGDTDVIAEGQVTTDAPATEPGEVIMEDDPRWDCRVMGNRECGTQIAGTWYIVTFDETGQPTSVRER